MYQLVPKKKNLFVKIAGFIVVMAILKELFTVLLAPAPVSKQLDDFANSVNKRCPLVMDSMTTLTSCVASAGYRLHFNYQYRIAKGQVDTAYLEEINKQNILNRIKTDPALAFIRDNGLAVSAGYYDSTGVFICKVSVSPDEVKVNKQ